MIIYLATNRVNGKKYVGLTTFPLSTRKSIHKYEANKKNSPFRFHCAIRKYGFDSFDWDIIDSATSETELFEKEKEWVIKFDSFKNGYNSNEGGTGTINVPKGSNHYRSVLDDEDVMIIIQKLTEGKETIQQIADYFSVDKRVISDINRGRTYKDLIPDTPRNKRKKLGTKLSIDDVMEIKRMLFKKVKSSVIAEKFSISNALVSQIKHRKKYSDVLQER
ncbi:hypothetical protein [Microcystis phage MaeS]|nr:hypothetical protein [Microcystis phage MaeS]